RHFRGRILDWLGGPTEIALPQTGANSAGLKQLVDLQRNELNETEQPSIPGFRFVPRTGVIYVMHEAAGHGFSYEDPQWANLGQGSPETGPIPGAPPRIETVTVASPHQQYAPVVGNKDLCQAVADFYNAVYRRDKKSKYTREN